MRETDDSIHVSRISRAGVEHSNSFTTEERSGLDLLLMDHSRVAKASMSTGNVPQNGITVEDIRVEIEN